MARSDQIKEDLARWRLCFGLLAAIGVSLFAWVVQRLSSEASKIPRVGDLNLLWVALITVASVTVLLTVIYVAMVRKARELGELDER